MTLSEGVSDELIRRIENESWVDEAGRLSKQVTAGITLQQGADLTEVHEKLITLLKEWHQESAIILDDYRPLKIIRDDVNAPYEYFVPERNLPQAQLLALQIKKQTAILCEEYEEADVLQQKELDLMAKFLLSAFSRPVRS